MHVFSTEKLEMYYFIFTPKNLLENAKVSLGVLSVFKLDLKSFFSVFNSVYSKCYTRSHMFCSGKYEGNL